MKKGVGIPAIKKKTREAARAIIKHDELREEFDALLGLPEDQNQWGERENGVALVGDIRMDAAQRIVDIESKINATPKSDKKTLREMRSQRKEVLQEIIELPELGSTYEEWEELSEEEQSVGVGRPRLPLEVSLLRAEIDLNEAMKDLREVEDSEGRERQTREEIVDAYRKATGKTGRKRIDSLGVLDRDIRQVNQEIEYIESGQAEEDRRIKEEKSMAKYGKRQGRPPVPLSQKLDSLKEKRQKMVDKRSRMEERLSPVAKLDRQIKLKHDDIFFLRKSLREKGMDPAEVDVSGTYEGNQIEAAQADVEEIRSMIEKMNQATGETNELQQKQREKILEEESERIRKRNEKIRSEARDKMGVGEIEELARDVGANIS